jgi:hypothetical protein
MKRIVILQKLLELVAPLCDIYGSTDHEQLVDPAGISGK